MSGDIVFSRGGMLSAIDGPAAACCEGVAKDVDFQVDRGIE